MTSMDKEPEHAPSAIAAESAPQLFSPSIPLELWTAILHFVIAPLTQFMSSPAAAAAANMQEVYTARKALLQFAHVNKTTYAAARPHLYGTLSIALREKPEHDGFSFPKRPIAKGRFLHQQDAASHANMTYLVDREQFASVSRVFPGWCRTGKACSKAHLDRDQRIAQVTEVPEVFPFVVLGGKLYLASLAANEKGADVETTAEEVEAKLEAIRRSAASLLLDGTENEMTESIHVRIANSLVLVQYPLHLVTALHLRTGSVDPSHWINTGNEDAERLGRYYDWNLKLPFIFAIPPRQLRSLTLSTNPKGDNTFSAIMKQLFEAFPHISTLDVLVNAYRYNYASFPKNIQNAFMFQLSRPWDWDILPMELGCRPVRNVEIYGEHPWLYKDWERLFNNPTLVRLVTVFDADGHTDGPIALGAPRLKSWTTSTSRALDAFNIIGSWPDHDTTTELGTCFPALQELAIIPQFSGDATLGHPDIDSQVPAIPFSCLAKSLRKFTVSAKGHGVYLWTHIRSNLLADLLALPLLASLHLPNAHPSFDPPFAAAGATITCAHLSTLEVNLKLFHALLPCVAFPRLSSLTLVGDYTPEDEHQFTSDLWIQIASSSFGPHLTHFASRRIPIDTDAAWPFAFPPNSPVLPRLQSIDLFASIGHVDVTHLPTIAPNLRSGRFDVDHLGGLDSMLAHPTLKSLTLADMRCPTTLEHLLANRLRADLTLNVCYRDNVGLFGTSQTVIGNADLRVCARQDMTLVYDRQRNKKTWCTLASSMFESMPRGQVQAITIVVPGDLAQRERIRVLLALKHVARVWEGTRVKVGVLGQGEVEGGSEVSEMPIGVQELVAGLRKLGHGSIVGEIEWMGRVEGGPLVGTRCYAHSEL